MYFSLARQFFTSSIVIILNEAAKVILLKRENHFTAFYCTWISRKDGRAGFKKCDPKVHIRFLRRKSKIFQGWFWDENKYARVVVENTYSLLISHGGSVINHIFLHRSKRILLSGLALIAAIGVSVALPGAGLPRSKVSITFGWPLNWVLHHHWKSRRWLRSRSSFKMPICAQNHLEILRSFPFICAQLWTLHLYFGHFLVWFLGIFFHCFP